MIFKISTPVKAPLKHVKEKFNEELFIALNPPFPKVMLQQFDGCKKGDIVSLELDFLFFRQVWTSEIVLEEVHEDLWTFIDEGRRLPFFVKSWRHVHSIKSSGLNTIIVDHISYSTGSLLTDWLVFPGFYFMFLYRKPIYRRKLKA